MDRVVAVFAIVMGLAIAVVWTRDILASPTIDRTQGLLRAREPGTGSLFLPHWIAEYATAVALITGGIGSLLDAGWATELLLVAFGALAYTSTNALGWALARPDRRLYALPMQVGAIGAVISIVALMAGS